MTEIIIAVITAISAVLGSYLANNKSIAVLQEQIKDIKKDITTLSNRVDKHNNLIERMTVVEQATKSAQHQINELKQKGA